MLRTLEIVERDEEYVGIILDQRALPMEEKYLEVRSSEDVARAIEEMAVRGAPAIGLAGVLAIAISVLNSKDFEEAMKSAKEAYSRVRKTRPTARNLFWATDKIMKSISSCETLDELKEVAIKTFREMAKEDEETNKRIGYFGAKLIKDGQNILTHCNAGALACYSFGTALGVIRAAWREGKRIHVYVDETRPLLQGARLTAWELLRDGIPHTVIVDSAAGYLMSKGEIDLVIVGADRITMEGDVANKIGTYTLAVLAEKHNIPFYVAAPTSTIDPEIESGDQIKIEVRSEEEVKKFLGLEVSPRGSRAYNPAFDVTPGEMITGIITEKGILTKPFKEKIAELFKK